MHHSLAIPEEWRRSRVATINQAAVVAEVLAEEMQRCGSASVVGLGLRCLDPTESHKGFRPQQLAWLPARQPHWGRRSDRLSLDHKGLAPGTPERPYDRQTHPAGLAQPYGYTAFSVSPAFLCPHTSVNPLTGSLFCFVMLLPGEPALWQFPRRRLCVLSVHNGKTSFRNCFLSSVVGR